MKLLVYLSFFFGFFGVIKAYSQPNVTAKAKYIARNQDFVERRSAGVNQSFASLYHSAYHEYLTRQRSDAAKREFPWTPVGPLGKERLSGTGRVNSITFHPTDTATLFICVAQGGVWKSTNSGTSWTNISKDLPIQRTSDLAIHPKNPDIMYVALGDVEYLGHNIFANENKRNTHYGLGVYKTDDGGDTWFPTGLSFLQTEFEGSLLSGVMIHPENPDTVIAVGQSGSYLSFDGGANWKNTHEGLFWDLKNSGQSPNILHAATGFITSYGYGEAGILRSTDFGETWEEAVVPFKSKWEVERIELAPSKSDPSIVYALACNANPWSMGGAGFHGVYVSSDGGKTFSTKTDSTFRYNMLAGRFNNDVGGQGRYDLAFYVDDKNPNRLHLGGVNMWTSTNGGRDFLPSSYWALNYRDKSLHGDVHQIKQHPSTGRFFVCHDGGLSSSMDIKGDPVSMAESDPSTIWRHHVDNLNITAFYRLGLNPLSSNSLSAGAQDNSTAYLFDGKWTNTSGGDGMETAFDPLNYVVYFSSQYGNIYEYGYSETNGEVVSYNYLDPPSQQPAEWTSPMQVSNGKLYVGYGDVFQYQSFGSFEALSSFSNAPNRPFARPASALYVNKANDNVMYLAKRGYASEGTQGQVFHTFDHGDNWKDISKGLPLIHYPSYVVADESKPGRVWITFASWEKGEKVYYSDNSGETWTNMSFDLPNVPVNCVVQQTSETERIYVGTDLGVFYLDEENKTWVPFNDGLPALIISELEIDKTGAKMYAATFGRGIWEVRLSEGDGSSIQDEMWATQMKVYPNPSTDRVLIQWTGSNEAIKTLRILDITGREVYRNADLKGLSQLELKTEKWLSGQYFVILEGGQGRTVNEIQKVD